MKEIKLTDDEIDMIQRIQNGRYTDSDYDPYEVDHAYEILMKVTIKI